MPFSFRLAFFAEGSDDQHGEKFLRGSSGVSRLLLSCRGSTMAALSKIEPMRIRFEDCVFDSDTRQVFRGGSAVSLSPKAFQLLEMLIRERPKAVDKHRIHTELWPGVFVSEANLPNLVTELRSAMGDNTRKPRVIRTVRTFGYAFSAPTTAISAGAPVGHEGPIYRLILGDREIALEFGENLIGRAPDSALFVDDFSVSRRHARIVIDDSGAVLEDLGSKNGTLVRGRRIAGARRLADKDSIEIGPAHLIFRAFRKTGSTASKKRS
jgi:DNA-binding winged helix-turn-helix (wHTH) protein